MRKKREQQKQAAIGKTTAESNKNKANISGDDKIFNILSNTENQRLINNLLGIGKTLGLTGKQNAVAATSLPLPPPPPPPPETNSGDQSVVIQGAQQAPSQPNVIGSNAAQPSWSNQQQWVNNQYNPRIEATGYGVPSSVMSVMHQYPSVPFGHPMMPSNFAQPPPSLPPNNNGGMPPNFSQPPPNFPIISNNSNNQENQERPVALQNATRGPVNPPPQDPSSMGILRFTHYPNDRGSFDDGQQSNFLRRGGEDHQDHRFARRGDGPNSNPNGKEDQFIKTNDSVSGRQNDPFHDRFEAQQRFRRGDRSYGTDFGHNSLNAPNNAIPSDSDVRAFGSTKERFGPPINERFVGGSNRFGPMGNDRFASPSDRFIPSNDRLGSDRFSGNEHFVESETDRFCRSGPIDRLGPGNEHRFDRPDNERFGVNDRFERLAGPFADRPGLASDCFEPKDRGFPLPPVNTRFGPNTNEHFGPNDRFGRGSATDCFDLKDANDHRRGDTFANNLRGFNRNPSFSPLNEMSPELRKLMEKRKAAGDVFRPSFVSNSDRTTNVGSLSESFKKITGDSPFRCSFDFPKISRPGLSSANNYSNSASGGPSLSVFQTHTSSISDSGSSSYSHHLRGGDQLFNNAHDNEVSLLSGFKQGPSNSFVKHDGPMDYNERTENTEIRLQNPKPQQPQLANIQSHSPIKHSGEAGTGVNSDFSNLVEQNNGIQDTKNTEEIKRTNETDIIEQKNDCTIACKDDDSSKKENDNLEKSELSASNDGDSLQQKDDNNKEYDNSGAERKVDSSDKNDEGIAKKPESLPFMGENDPRPEDLNIEPPPELPNLGPVSTNTNPGSQNADGPFNEIFDGKEPTDNQLEARFESSAFPEPREMKFKANSPFGPRSSSTIFGAPRAPHAFPMSSGPFQSPLVDNTQLGQAQTSNTGQFGPNTGPNNGGRFRSRRSNNELLAGEASRGPSGEEFGSGEQSSPFESSRRSPENGIFQLRSRDPGDLSFASRNLGPFGARGNDMQFRSRGPNDRSNSGVFGPREFNDISLGTRYPGDSMHFDTTGPSNSRFGRLNETPFGKQPSFDNGGSSFGFSGGSRKSSEDSSIGLRGLNDTSFGGPHGPSSNNIFPQELRSPKISNETRFDSRDFNDRPFDFKDKSLTVKGLVGDSNNTSYTRRSGTYTRRKQFEERQFENPTMRSDDPTYDRARHIDVEMRKDCNEYARRTPGTANDVRKNKFNDDQRNIDKNLIFNNASQFDERSRLEKTVIGEPRITNDFQSGYDEADLSLEHQSKLHGSSLFVKRSQSMRSPGGSHHGEFCAPRQFNYNHGEVDGSEKKFVEYTPARVIDYGHTSRPTVINHHLSSPVQCFDYAHGDLKPIVPLEQQHQDFKRDSRNWVESEQNVKEFDTEKMRNLKEYVGKKTKSGYDNYEKCDYAARRSTSSDYGKQRIKEHMDWQQQVNDESSSKERERRENEDRKERSSVYEVSLEEQQRFFERDSVSDQSGDRCYQSDRSLHRGNL